MPLEHTWSVSNLFTRLSYNNLANPQKLPLPLAAGAFSISFDPDCNAFKFDMDGDISPVSLSELEKAARLAVSITTPTPANVCFVFPRSSRRLYANETVLRQASPYFETLFSSEFEEAKAQDPSLAEAESSPPVDPYTFNDSDEEVDGILKSPSSAATTYSVPCKIVRVVDTAYSTYHALLLWLLTGTIVFSPLRSTALPPALFDAPTSNTPHQTRVLSLVTKQSPLLPPPVSCKSIYRLSHLLQLPSLPSLALTFYKTQLTPSNAAQELYSDFCGVYGEPKEVSMAFVVERWKEVEGSEGLKKVEERAARGEAGSEAARTARGARG